MLSARKLKESWKVLLWTFKKMKTYWWCFFCPCVQRNGFDVVSGWLQMFVGVSNMSLGFPRWVFKVLVFILGYRFKFGFWIPISSLCVVVSKLGSSQGRGLKLGFQPGALNALSGLSLHHYTLCVVVDWSLRSLLHLVTISSAIECFFFSFCGVGHQVGSYWSMSANVNNEGGEGLAGWVTLFWGRRLWHKRQASERKMHGRYWCGRCHGDRSWGRKLVWIIMGWLTLHRLEDQSACRGYKLVSETALPSHG